MKSNARILFGFIWICCVIHADLSAQTVVAQSQYRFQQSQYRFQNFSIDDGLYQNATYSVLQDSLGFLWMHHPLGLTRFDGYSFKIYRYNASDSIGSPGRILDGRILLDRSGNLWAKNGQQYERGNALTLSKYDRKTDSFTKYKPNTEGAFVYRMCFDKNNSIWLGTWSGQGLYNFNPQTQETKKYLSHHADAKLMEESNAIFEIIDRDSFLLLATLNGLWKFDKGTKTFSRPNCNPQDTSLLYHLPIIGILDKPSDDRDELWLYVYGGSTGNWRALLKLNENYAIDQRLNLPEKFQYYDTNVAGQSISLDKKGILWILTLSHGLLRYNPNDSSFTNISSIPGDPNSLPSTKIMDVFVDREQNVWVSGARGISKLRRNNLRFHNVDVDGVLNLKLTHDENEKNDNLVLVKNKIGAAGHDELIIASIASHHPGSLHFESVNLKVPIPGQARALWRGKKHLWIGTWADGVYGLPIDLQSGAISVGPMITMKHDPENPNTISANYTSGIWEDSEENLWVGTFGEGLNKVRSNISYGKEGSVVRYMHDPLDTSTVSSNVIMGDFYPEGETSFWISTASGIDLFRNGRFEHFFVNEFAMNIQRTTQGKLFIAAMDGFYESVKLGDRYNFKKMPLASNACAFDEDKEGRFWISACDKLIFHDPKEQVTIEFGVDDGVSHIQDQIIRTSNGVMVMSDHEGLTLFDPSSLEIDRAGIIPTLTSLKVNNESPAIEKSVSSMDAFAIKTDITMLKELVLDYKHTNFSIGFSAIEMIEPEKNRYQHQLEGFDKVWIETDYKNRVATYTNLDAGTYVFKVKASNHHGVWSKQETVLLVRILPAPWKTWWAYSLYAIAFLGAIVWWMNYDVKRVKLKHRAEHLSELDHLKTRFFTNITHEFRTPLTVILGMADQLDGSYRNIKSLITRNANNLLRLVNQLLDLSKLEAGMLTFRLTQSNIIPFLRYIYDSFHSLAEQKKITIHFLNDVNELMMDYDADKIQNILCNLLSNAIKFTHENGHIYIIIEPTEINKKAAVKIRVKDTGVGISHDHLPKIFDRFYQAGNSTTRTGEGTGIGLALTHELVKLMKGTISVESELNKGTEFIVILPITNDAPITETIEGTEAEQSTEENIFFAHDLEISTSTELKHKPLALVVEDNDDVVHYLKACLQKDYDIVVANNGNVGIQKAVTLSPEIIISDVMMPEKNGYELCQTLKTDERTSHIPIILVTAKATEEDKIEGLEVGADAYLIKPFNAKELSLQINNLISIRKKLWKDYKDAVIVKPRELNITSPDKKFLTKVFQVLEDKKSDPSFGTEAFLKELGMSRTLLHVKLKALTGQSTTEVIRTFRLKYAAQLIQQNFGNISEVAYEAGFNDQSYFTKCFKSYYGVAPSDYVKKVSQ